MWNLKKKKIHLLTNNFSKNSTCLDFVDGFFRSIRNYVWDVSGCICSILSYDYCQLSYIDTPTPKEERFASTRPHFILQTYSMSCFRPRQGSRVKNGAGNFKSKTRPVISEGFLDNITEIHALPFFFVHVCMRDFKVPFNWKARGYWPRSHIFDQFNFSRFYSCGVWIFFSFWN